MTSRTLADEAQSQSRPDEIDRAVQRCERGNYGICEGCGETIPAERLAARPAARTCLRCAVLTSHACPVPDRVPNLRGQDS